MCENRCPWQGFKPYSEEDAEFFNGRSKAIDTLLKNIETKTVTVCYAESGIGKSSLINAGLVPNLREQKYLPISIRFNFEVFKDKKQDEIKALFCNQIVDAIRNAKNTFEEKNNPYKLIWDIPEKVADVNLSNLWMVLRNAPKVSLSINGFEYFNVYKPFLILDQFEQLLYDSNSPIVIESFFELLKNLVLNDTFSDRYLMMREKKLVNDEEDSFKVLVSLRQEYIGVLDYWCMSRVPMPSLHDNRYSLQPLTMQEAKEVLLPKGYDIFEDVVDYVIEISKANNEVSSILLSVICRKLYDQAPLLENGKKAKISDVEVEQKKETIIKDYYKDQLEKAQKGYESLLSDEIIHRIEEVLVNEDGKRTLLAVRDGYLQGIRFSESIKNQLENNGIIRSERIGRNVFVELIHDRIAAVVLDLKNDRKEQEEKKKRRDANYKRYISRQNPLTLTGRRIWDNKNFSFSVDNSRSNSLQNSSSRTDSLSELLQQRTIDDGGVEQMFFNKLFQQSSNVGKISLEFNESYSKDGISVFEIETERVRGSKQLKIKEICFFRKNDSGIKEAFYTADGFRGIKFEYDETGNELKRKYICDVYTSVGIVSIEFYYENKEFPQLPSKAMYFDNNDNPCKHIDGNYGVEITYDDYGREECRWFLNEKGNYAPIYNGVCGLVNEYDELDRVTKQYFIDKDRMRVFDNYDFHGIKIKYNNAPNELLASETIYIDDDNVLCNNPQGFCIEQLQYDDKGRVIWQSYLDKDRNEVEKKDGVYFYSKLKIGYNESDKPDNLAMYNLSGIIFKIIRYTYKPNGTISEYSFYESKKAQNGLIERKSDADDNKVHKIKYEHDDKHGVLVSLEYFDKNDNPMKDSNGYSKICLSYNNSGVLVERRLYNFEKTEKYPVERIIYKYMDDETSEITHTEYEVLTKTNTIKKILETLKDKEEKDKEEQIAVKEKSYKGVVNHRCELVKVYWGEDNDYIPETPLTVQRKYDIDGNVVEELLFDIKDKYPICDEDGTYGWHIDYDKRTGLKNHITYLGESGEIANNKYNYAVIKYSYEEYEGVRYFATSYFDKSYKPAISKYGYHKRLEKADFYYNDDLCKQAIYLNRQGEPCNCIDGYHKQVFYDDQDNNRHIVSFFNSEQQPVMNKALGFHKREDLFSNDGFLISRSFYDEVGHLVNASDGYAKLKIKKYDSFSTLFFYPFIDHDVIRFYDENEQKVNVKYKGYVGYKFLEPANDISLIKVENSKGKLLYWKKSLLWRCINIVWIPVAIVIFLIVFPLYNLLKWLYNLFKSKQTAIPESATVIRIAQIFDDVPNGESSIFFPIKLFDVEEGCWIVKWNHWSYDCNQDVATEFETELNNSLERKIITFYNPNEKEFLDIDIKCENLGLRIQDAQVPINEVNDMMERWHTYMSRELSNEK